MAKNMTPEIAHRAVYRKAQDPSRFARGIIARLMPGVLLIAALLLFARGLGGDWVGGHILG